MWKIILTGCSVTNVRMTVAVARNTSGIRPTVSRLVLKPWGTFLTIVSNVVFTNTFLYPIRRDGTFFSAEFRSLQSKAWKIARAPLIVSSSNPYCGYVLQNRHELEIGKCWCPSVAGIFMKFVGVLLSLKRDKSYPEDLYRNFSSQEISNRNGQANIYRFARLRTSLSC